MDRVYLHETGDVKRVAENFYVFLTIILVTTPKYLLVTVPSRSYSQMSNLEIGLQLK